MKNSLKFDFWNKTKKIVKKLSAFTVAELVIAVAGIALISTLTLGTITRQIDIQKNTVARTTLNNEFAVSLADMHADGKLIGAGTDLEFAQKLQEYFGVQGYVVTKTGARGPLNAAGKAPEYEPFAAENFAPKYRDYTGTTVLPTSYTTLFKSDKGASIALTYNSNNCNITGKFVTDASSGETSSINKYDFTAKNEALTCITGIYDINGPKGPNKFGEDVGYFNPIKANCPANGNFAADMNGKCTICTITNANCKADNKTLDKNTCSCKCTRKCPNGMSLDAQTCTCKCPTIGEYNKDYCEPPKDNTYSCLPVLKKATTPAQCTLSGSGTWDAKTCDCKCDNKSCFNSSYGYGLAQNDPKAHKFCECKCKYKDTSAEFQAQVRANAMADGLSGDVLNQVVNNTIPANYGLSTSLGCYACKTTTSEDGNITYELRNGYCAAGCNADAQAKCDTKGDFFKWIPYNPNDPSNSCKCVCNTEAKKKELESLNKEFKKNYKILNMTEPSKTIWQVLREAVEIGKITTGSTNDRPSCPASYAYRDYSCTYCNSAKNNEVTQRVVKAYLNDGAIPSANSEDIPKYTFNEKACAFEFDKSQIEKKYNPSSITNEVHMHGACNNWWGWQFKNMKWIAGTNPPKNPNTERPTGVPGYDKSISALSDNYWTNLKLTIDGVAYYHWADPIILNYTDRQDSTNDLKNHITTNKVSFGLHWEGKGKPYKIVETPWIQGKKKINQSHLFLVAPNAQGKVPDVSYMFSDQKESASGDLYTTGLEQLAKEYDTTVDVAKKGQAKFAYETGLVNKNDANFSKLRAWWDANSNAVVDNGELKTLEELKIIEFNTHVIRNVDASGEVIQNENAVFGIAGQYKRLVSYSPWKNCTWWGCNVKDYTCHVKPVYDKTGKQLLDTWELDEETSSWGCKTFIEKTTLNQAKDDIVQNVNDNLQENDFISEDNTSNTSSVDNKDNRGNGEGRDKDNKDNKNNKNNNSDQTANTKEESAQTENTTNNTNAASNQTQGVANSTNAATGATLEESESSEEVKQQEESKYYVIYSPRMATSNKPDTSLYKDSWMKNNTNRDEYTNTYNHQFIKLYKIGNEYYTEKIYNMNDVIFVF